MDINLAQNMSDHSILVSFDMKVNDFGVQTCLVNPKFIESVTSEDGGIPTKIWFNSRNYIEVLHNYKKVIEILEEAKTIIIPVRK